jgi:hypothetical protein
MLLGPAAGANAEAPATLGGGHLGVALEAPGAPLVGGAPASTVIETPVAGVIR